MRVGQVSVPGTGPGPRPGSRPTRSHVSRRWTPSIPRMARTDGSKTETGWRILEKHHGVSDLTLMLVKVLVESSDSEDAATILGQDWYKWSFVSAC